MMKNRVLLGKLKWLSVGFTILVLLLSSALAMADRGRNDYNRYRHDDRSWHSSGHRDYKVPHGYISARHGHKTYYVHHGRFYRHTTGGFVAIGLPFGAVISTLPIGYVSVNIGGLMYYMVDGIYYRPYHSGGYVVVTAPTPPATTITTSVVVVRPSALNVRSGPGVGYSVVGEVFGGDNLVVLGTAPSWYYVQMPEGRHGWVMRHYVRPGAAIPRG